MKPKPAEVDVLLERLAESKLEYARTFLGARTQGTEIVPGKAATLDDARMWTRRNLGARGIEDSEVIRWRLVALLGHSLAEME